MMFNILNIEELQAGGALSTVTTGRPSDSVSNTQKFTPPIKDNFLQKKKKIIWKEFYNFALDIAINFHSESSSSHNRSSSPPPLRCQTLLFRNWMGKPEAQEMKLLAQ